ncbi:hypothetical protein IMZ48_38215 [Candidatus Bathyarchaeota archaeon]|nr:hypothetical protein [Candidatus Bathyarchaeota archaeon]
MEPWNPPAYFPQSQNLTPSQDEFRARLDEALILAISSEYDLNDKTALQSVRDALATIAKDAEAEEASGFNPDGLGTGPKNSGDDSTDLKSSHETSRTMDNSGTRDSLTSSDTSYPEDGSDESSVPRIDSFDDATEEAKNRLLASMFPSLEQGQVDDSLEQAGGDFQGALDNLLTLQFLQSTEVRATAIDAFSGVEDEEYYQGSTNNGKNGKGKKKRNKCGKKSGKKPAAASRGEDAELEETSEYDSIMYISERLNLPFEGVSHAYHKNARSQGKTAAAVLDPFIAQGVTAQGTTASARVYELGRRYKKVPVEYLSAIVQIADIPQWAEEIATLLENHFGEVSAGPLGVSYSLAPIDDEVEDGFSVVAGKKNNGKENVRNAATFGNGGSAAALRSQAAGHEQARLSASASAASVLRRGRSNPLYRQATVVYTEQARDFAQRASKANLQAAHRIVAERRTADSIDLHGLLVSDGVSIALGAVKQWYDNLGEYRVRDAPRRGFTVITGVGKHSAGGVSRMRTGVSRGLVTAGWKVEVGTGNFVVTGRR